MSCDNVQELISPLIDRKIPAAERESLLAHLESCRECGAHFESMQNLRRALSEMNRAAMPPNLAARLRVMASHELARHQSRATLSDRFEHWSGHLRLWFDNLMRPLAVPFAGGIVSALVLFSALVPSFSVVHDYADADWGTDPYGQVVVLSSTGVNSPGVSADVPKIEPTYASYPEDATVVWLMIDESGKVVNYQLAKGNMTSDMQTVIMLSKFMPATFLGIPTPGLVKMVQRPTSRRTLRS
jgi:hypothetical protein